MLISLGVLKRNGKWQAARLSVSIARGSGCICQKSLRHPETGPDRPQVGLQYLSCWLKRAQKIGSRAWRSLHTHATDRLNTMKSHSSTALAFWTSRQKTLSACNDWISEEAAENGAYMRSMRSI